MWFFILNRRSGISSSVVVGGSNNDQWLGAYTSSQCPLHKHLEYKLRDCNAKSFLCFLGKQSVMLLLGEKVVETIILKTNSGGGACQSLSNWMGYVVLKRGMAICISLWNIRSPCSNGASDGCSGGDKKYFFVLSWPESIERFSLSVSMASVKHMESALCHIRGTHADTA